MNHAREVDLIRSIDQDVRQLLDRCDALAGAGDERPLLTLVGRRLRDQLREVAELSGSLAALLAAEGGGPGPAPRTRPSDRETTAVASFLRRDPTAAAAMALGRDDEAASDAPVIRLKPRMPRGAWRRRGASGPSRRGPVSRDPGEAPAESAPPAGPVAGAPDPGAPQPPVYRLRKAGGGAASDAGPARRDGRDALQRLRDFLHGGPADEAPATGTQAAAEP